MLSQSTPCNYLNVKHLLARNKHDIWNLCDCNKIQTCNHLAPKRNIHLNWPNSWVLVDKLMKVSSSSAVIKISDSCIVPSKEFLDVLAFSEWLLCDMWHEKPLSEHLCIQHSDTPFFSKNNKKFIWSENLKKHILAGGSFLKLLSTLFNNLLPFSFHDIPL